MKFFGAYSEAIKTSYKKKKRKKSIFIYFFLFQNENNPSTNMAIFEHDCVDSYRVTLAFRKILSSCRLSEYDRGTTLCRLSRVNKDCFRWSFSARRKLVASYF